MDYSLKEVAGRIKDLREAKGYSVEELAKLTGVSVEEYEVLEKGETDFSFTFIYKCAKACGVEVVDILEGTSSTLTSFAITRKQIPHRSGSGPGHRQRTSPPPGYFPPDGRLPEDLPPWKQAPPGSPPVP